MKKSFAILLALITLLVACLPALADVDPANIDPEQTGALHIVKYEYNTDPSYATATGGTGVSGQTPPDDAEPLGGVKFSLYKIGDLDTYFAQDGAALPTPAAVEDEGMINGVVPVVKTTTAEGVADFTGLAQGVYYVKETNAPARVTTPSNPFVVTIPWTNPEGTEWLYDVYVYPKNAATYGKVTINKTDESTPPQPLAGAKFKLQKWDTDLATPAWVDVDDATALTTGDDGTVTADGLFANMNYRLIETAAPSGYVVDATKAYYFKINGEGKVVDCDLVSMPTDYPSKNISIATDGENITITNPKQTVEKEITGGAGSTSASVGDIVSFDIKTTAPPSINDLQSFYLVDTLSTGLTYDPTDCSVSVDGMTENNEYTVSVVGQKITITFDPAKLTGGQNIRVTLTAKINENAVVGTAGDGNPNDVELKYDHDTETGDQPGDPVPPPDKPKVYVAQVTLNKVKEDGTTALTGASFALQKMVDGSWTDVETISEGSTFTFKKIGAGTYRLIEKKAPAGYNLLKNPIEFTLTFNAETKTFTNSNSGFSGENGTYTITVKNSKGFDLPKTGGMGTILYTVGGVALIGIALFLFLRPRKNKEKAN